MKKAIYTFLTAFCANSVLFAECDWCGVNYLTKGSSSSITRTTLKWSRGEADVNRIDVMLAYDSSAQRYLAEQGKTVEEFSREAIEGMNYVISQTGIDEKFTFALAGHAVIASDFSEANMSLLTMRLAGVADSSSVRPVRNALQQYRDQVKADVVAVFIDTASTTRGMSMPLTSDDMTASGLAAYAEEAYSVCDIKSVGTKYTLIHEIGHLMGAGHSDVQISSPGPQLWKYSAGYRFTLGGETFTTVMGYPNSEIARLPFFSSPDWLYEGVAIGTAAKNDNTRTLLETYRLVANFRVANYGAAEEEDLEIPDIALTVANDQGVELNDGDTLNLTALVKTSLSVSASNDEGRRMTVKVSGLPTGLKYTSKTGLITGYPKKAGTFAVKITARASGLETNTFSFTVKVASAPASIAGTYCGILTDGDETSLATATVTSAGKVTLKYRCQGANRSFTATGFDSVSETGGGSAFSAAPSVRIKGTSVSRTVSISSRAITVDGVAGTLLQCPWSRSDITAPKIRKSISSSWNGLKAKCSTKGRVSLSGTLDGARVSGTFQIVAEDATAGDAVYRLPIYFAAKKQFAGLAVTVPVTFVKDESGSVTGFNLEDNQ